MNKEFFIKSAFSVGIELNNDQIRQFEQYQDLLLDWNEKINLTAITDEQGIVVKHFTDSLTCMKYIDDNSKILDIGTGAGFPGIPLKIMKEKLNVTLLDSLNKRIIYLNDVINKLKLTEINAIHGRAEELGKNKEYREKFDFVTARAVANLRILSEYCLPFVKINGCFLAMKGSNIDEEITESNDVIEKLGGKIENIEKIVLFSDEEIVHHIVQIRKIKNTPKEFPRRIVK